MAFPIPFRNSIDLEQNQLVRAVIDLYTGADPSNPANGQIWYRDDAGSVGKHLWMFDGVVPYRWPRLDKIEDVSQPWNFSFGAGSPFTVVSSVKVDNLNADLLDGFNTAQAASASTVMVRDANARGKVADPTASDDIVNLGYMQAYVSGATSPKTAMRMAAGAALPANTRTSNILTADANGSWNAMVSKVVSDATNATPIVVTTTTAHGFTSGDQVLIAAVGGNTAANGTWSIAVTGPTTFSLNGSAGNGAYTSGGTAGQSLDGLVGALNDRVIVLSEVLGANNGLYYISDLGGAGTPWTLTRTTDADTSAEVLHGLSTWVTSGKLYGNSGWLLTTPDPITLNTTTLTFIQNGGSSQIIAGNGIVKDGNFIHAVTSSAYTPGSFIYASGTTTLAQAQITGLVQGNGASAPTAVTGTQYGLVYWATTTTGGTTAAGTANTVLHGNASGAPTWSPIVNSDITNATIVLTTKVTGTLPIANGGTASATAVTAFNALSPLTTRGDLLTQDGTNNIRLAIGTSGKFIRSDGTDASWQNIAATDITSGVLPIARGGTNNGSLAVTLGGIVYADGTKLMLATGTTNQFVRWDTTGAPQDFNLFGTSNTWTVTQAFTRSNSFTTIISGKAVADATTRWIVSAGGQMSWGDGAATLDAFLFRQSAGVIQIQDNLRVTGLTASQIVLTDSNKQLVSSATLSVTLGGTGANLSATGGASQYLKQSSVGGAITVGTIPAADLPGAFAGFANPSAVVGLAAVNGSAVTAMRSDGAPALDQSIAPTWTAAHLWTGASIFTGVISVQVTGEAAARFGVFAGGTLGWGDGTNSLDTFVYRQSATVLYTPGSMIFNTLTASTVVFTDSSKMLVSTGTVAIANGGTNGTAVPTAGAIPYGTGTAYAFSAAGTAGQLLTSGGAGAPTWGSISSLNITRKYSTTFTGTAYNVSSYIDITHNLGTYGIKVEVYRTKDEAGAADANQQTCIPSILRPVALGTNQCRIYMGLNPDPDEEFAVVVFG